MKAITVRQPWAWEAAVDAETLVGSRLDFTPALPCEMREVHGYAIRGCGQVASWEVRTRCEACGHVHVDLLCTDHKRALLEHIDTFIFACPRCDTRVRPPRCLSIQPL